MLSLCVSLQLKSIRKLLDFDFQWILPATIIFKAWSEGDIQRQSREKFSFRSLPCLARAIICIALDVFGCGLLGSASCADAGLDGEVATAAAGTARIRRQKGQDEWDPNQVSTQATWKPWPHCGRTRTWSPSANSARQMGQTESFPLPPGAEEESKECVGRERRAFFSRPVSVGRKTEAAAAREGRSQAQRATTARPRTQMRPQRSAARKTMRSESTERGSCGPAAWRLSEDWRNLDREGNIIPERVASERTELRGSPKF
ncbi:hypothetical protein MUK42_37776 [Musa troglodytarum]|uniref:Uncharacterized protein n=1 Tax=Musa troglodytarum TaxID=320322 RepID=A0A9E7FI77_9LILI|nr:hypothetical protein MUK42_37776 [Musa troglodytarum]